MKRLCLLACLLCCLVAACAPEQPAALRTADGEARSVTAPLSSDAASPAAEPAVEKIDAFLRHVPEARIPGLYQVQSDAEIRIPPLTEREAPPVDAPPPLPAGQGVGLNFENADIHDVAKVVSEITGKTFVVDEGVSGDVTIYSETSLTPDQVFELFKSVLELNELALTRVGDFYKIVQSDKARERYLSVDSTGGPVTDDLVTQIVKLQYVKGKEVKAALETLTGSDIVVYPDEETGSTLIITDLASNVRKLQAIIAEMDVSQYAEQYHVNIFPVEYADLSTIIQDLYQILSLPGAAGAFEQAEGTGTQAPPEDAAEGDSLVPPGTATRLYPIDRLNALMVSSNNPDVIDLVEKWIRILDKPSRDMGFDSGLDDGERRNYVYPLRYSKAADLAPLLVEVYQDVNQQAQQEQEAAEDQPAQAVTPAQVFIKAEEATNSLVIRATQQQYAQLLALLDELDQRPPQVLIDVIIAEVRLTDSDVFGVKGMLQGQDQLTVGGETNVFTGTAETSFPGLGGDGFNYLLSAPSRFLLELKALATEGRVKVLSDPHILVQNNKQAKINIGDTIPITTTKGEGENAETTVEYQQTGIILTVTPQINRENDVVMQITQEVSSPGTKESGDAAPPINKTVAQTELITQDGQPLVIGGLMRSQATNSTQGVPLLKDLPLIGRLFRFNETQNTRNELVILVLPRVIRTPEQGWNVTDDALQKRVKQLEELFNREKTDADRVKDFLHRQFLPSE